MPIFTIRHVTTYRYRQPVSFGEHRMMLLPRDDGDQRVLTSEIDITPAPSAMNWTRDGFGNHVATASFTQQASELRFESTIRLNHVPAGSPQPILRRMLGFIPSPMAAKSRNWRAISCRFQRTRRLFAGQKASCARMVPPIRTRSSSA